MLPQRWSSAGALQFPRLLSASKSHNDFLLLNKRKQKPSSPSSSLYPFVCLRVGTDAIAEIAHNKVIVAAVVSAAIGQISKPFASVFLYGNKFEININSAFRAGGFPSAHSSAVVATATSLGLQRGFSDAIFGLAVVYAGIIMYDAQGVRREVGIHAKELNKILPGAPSNLFPSNDADNLVDSASGKPSSSSMEMLDPLFSEELGSFRSKKAHAPLLLRSDDTTNQNTQTLVSSSLSRDGKGDFSHRNAPLKESVGHTPIEVLAGAILGFFVSLIVHTLLI